MQRPLTAIVGGAKISDKILAIENLIDKADKLVVCGGMAYTFMKVLWASGGITVWGQGCNSRTRHTTVAEGSWEHSRSSGFSVGIHE